MKINSVLLIVFLVVMLPVSAFAKPKEKKYNNSAHDVFEAALKTARERHVVTYVDEKNLMFTFETGTSLTSYGFVANATIQPSGDNECTLIINVQKKNAGQNMSFAWGAGDRMADKFFTQVTEELGRKSQQKAAVKPAAPAVPVPPSSKVSSTSPSEVGTVDVSSTPPSGEVSVDGAFVGDAPAILKLSPGKHTIEVSETGFMTWSREISV
ncbi:MAG: PEGA domain-containing protein, partial [Candidatus Acidiferrales bacterium]